MDNQSSLERSRLATVSFLAALGIFVGPLVGATLNAVAIGRPVAGAFVIAALLGPPVAVVLGVAARREIRRSDGALCGRGLATAAIVMGALEIVLGVALV